ncbi:hypothetical protein CRUP_009730, partial [Coryphaenoides rupestris]
HTEKIYSLAFHPLASDLLVSSSYDLTVRLWDLGSGKEVKVLTGHQEQGLTFLPKTECDVRDVEVARALILTRTTLEPVAFKVPRVKKDFFQDDVYPDTALCWEAALSSSAWLGGANGQHRTTSLRPKDMTPVSEAPKEVVVRKYMPSSFYLEEKTDEQKKDE